MSANIDKSYNAKGFFYALGGTFLVSTNYVTAKYGLKGFNPETFSLIWTLAASFYTLVMVLISGRFRELAIPSKSVLYIIILGLATGAGMILGWTGLSLLDPSFASFLWRFGPVLMILLSLIFLGERLKYIEFIPIVVMVVGGAITTFGRWHIVGTGVVLTLLACVAVAIQMLIAKMKIKEIHPNILVFYRVSIAAVVIALWTLIRSKADFDVTSSYWLVTLLGAFLGPSMSFMFTFRSYKYWALSRSSTVLTAQPLIVLPMAFIVFGKIPTETELIGGFIILAGAFWLVLLHRTQIIQ